MIGKGKETSCRYITLQDNKIYEVNRMQRTKCSNMHVQWQWPQAPDLHSRDSSMQHHWIFGCTIKHKNHCSIGKLAYN